MVPIPLPGADEVNLVAKAGTSVVQGLRKAQQPPPWPDTRDALLELFAVLYEWNSRAEWTTRYAEELARQRRRPKHQLITPGSGVTISIAHRTNARVWRPLEADSRKLLTGTIPPLARLRGSSRRKAARRGLRTILAAYCPDLLEQFEAATTARSDWMRQYGRDFERWFDRSRTNEEVDALLVGLATTQRGLHEATVGLRQFITTNYPLAAAAPQTPNPPGAES